MTNDEYLDHMMDLVQTHGWAVQIVGAGEGEPQFAYTVGLTPLGLPEVITFGLPFDIMHALLNDVASKMVDENVLIEHGSRRDDILVGYPVEFVQALVTDEHLTVAHRLYGHRHRITALQMVWPDIQGRFPWDEGYSVGNVTIPLLGVRP